MGNQQRTQLLKDSDGVFSSSDSLDTDEVLGGVGLFSAPPKPTTEEFSIKSRKPPNTVAMSRRNNAPRRHSPVVSRPSRSQTPPISKMEPVTKPSRPSKPAPLALKNPFSPERRCRSYDANLDQLDEVEPLTPT